MFASQQPAVVVFHQHPYNVMGQKGINPWAPNNGITGFGQQLNANRTPAFNFSNFDYGYYDNYQQPEMSTMDWIMAGSMMLGQALKGAADITNAVKDINNCDKNKTTSDKLKEQWGGGYDMTFFNEIKSALKDVKALSSLNTNETKVTEKIKKLTGNGEDSYGSIHQGAQKEIDTAITDFESALNDTGVNIDLNTDSLTPEELQIDPNNLSSFDSGMQAINKDIDEVRSFVSTDIAGARTKLNEKSNELYGRMFDSKLTDAQRTEAQTQYNAIKIALEKLKVVEEKANSLQDALVETKGELLNAKKAQELILDKKYDLAKDLKKNIEDTQKDMDKLNEKIRKAIYTDKKSTSAQPVSDWITEYKNKATAMKGYLQNLGYYLGAEIKNSKGEGPVTLPTSIDAKYLDPLGYACCGDGDYVIETANKGSGVNIINNLSSQQDSFSKGMSVTLVGITYIYNGEFFEGSDGKKYNWDANQSKMIEQTT